MFEYAYITSHNTHRSVDAFRIALHSIQPFPVSCHGRLPHAGTVTIDGPSAKVYTTCGHWVELHLAVSQPKFFGLAL